jgi:DMSO/TMAO reductase YedYZ molybdopterin-dependent catalytic subunit
MGESQKRFQEAQQRLQAAQQEFAQAQQEFAAWQQAVAFETRHQQAKAVVTVATASLPATTPNKITPAPNANASEENKTEMVREVLAQHPTGMTPTEIWHAVKDRIARPYVYSILKRLRDSNEVMYQKKRKKYTLRIEDKQEESKGTQAVVH